MPVYRNVLFTKRNYECTNIVFCEANEKPKPTENWREVPKEDIENNRCTQLYIQGNVRYYGYL